jgi:hypothetical protein
MMLGPQAGPMNQNSSSLKRKDDGQVELQNHLAIAQLGHVASHVGIAISHGPNSGWRVARNCASDNCKILRKLNYPACAVHADTGKAVIRVTCRSTANNGDTWMTVNSIASRRVPTNSTTWASHVVTHSDP